MLYRLLPGVFRAGGNSVVVRGTPHPGKSRCGIPHVEKICSVANGGGRVLVLPRAHFLKDRMPLKGLRKLKNYVQS